jgi:hypothetical protein
MGPVWETQKEAENRLQRKENEMPVYIPRNERLISKPARWERIANVPQEEHIIEVKK